MTTKNETLDTFIEQSFLWCTNHKLNDKLVIPEKIKLEILDFKDFIGRPLSELKEHLEKNYITRLPDLRVMKHVWNNIDNYPELKTSTWTFCYFFGSILRYSDGDWSVPYVYWDGSGFSQHAAWLSGDWYSYYRVVLLADSIPSVAICPHCNKEIK